MKYTMWSVLALVLMLVGDYLFMHSGRNDKEKAVRDDQR